MCLYINFNIIQEKNSKKVTLGSLASGHLLGGSVKTQVYFLIKQETPKYATAIYKKVKVLFVFKVH